MNTKTLQIVTTTRVIETIDADQYIVLPAATTILLGATERIVKLDPSAFRVVVRESGVEGDLAILSTYGSEATFYCNGASWAQTPGISDTRRDVLELEKALMKTMAQVAQIVEYLNSNHATQGGDVDTVIRDAQVELDGSAEEYRITEIHTTDVTNAKVMAFSPGSATPVNFWVTSGAGAGDAPSLQVDGADTDINVNMVPKNDGRLQENTVDVALGVADTAPSTAAIVDPNAKTVCDALIATMKSMRGFAP